MLAARRYAKAAGEHRSSHLDTSLDSKYISIHYSDQPLDRACSRAITKGDTLNLRGFLRAFRSRKGMANRPKAPTSLADTARDAMHVRGGNMGSGGGFSGTEAVTKAIADGHEAYQKSFKDKK